MGELFGLKWKDVDFEANEVSVVRSIVMQVTGPCKTESSQKPIPLDPYLAEALRAWLEHVRYNRPEDWVFANPRMKGRQPYWGQEIMRRVIRPIEPFCGQTGGHQSHAGTAQARLQPGHDGHIYTQAVTAQKRTAQGADADQTNHSTVHL
jgi:integrase